VLAELATAPEGVTNGLLNVTREEALARAEGQPEWLRELRSRAFAAFESLEFPTRKLEEWRYTDVSQLKLDDVRLIGGSGMAPSRCQPRRGRMLAGKEAAAKVLLVGAVVAEIDLDPALAEQGVVVQDLATAAAERPELVREHLGSAVPMDADRLAA
jgi:Fe-S cluster assembly protein SufD